MQSTSLMALPQTNEFKDRLKYRDALSKLDPKKVKKDVVPGLFALATSQYQMKQLFPDLLKLTNASPQRDIMDAIDKAFPSNKQISYYAKMDEVLYLDNTLIFSINVYRTKTYIPKCSPASIPYLAMVDSTVNGDWLNRFFVKRVVNTLVKVIGYDMLCDPRVE